eukprot:8442461-Pyramimonas_sp.AAC.1
MLESAVVEAGSEFYSMQSRAPPCEDYSAYCTARRALLQQRLEVRSGKFEASSTEIKSIDSELKLLSQRLKKARRRHYRQR